MRSRFGANATLRSKDGFDFRFFTNLYRTQAGQTYYFCYDYGYLLLPDEKVLIVNRKTFMGPS